MDPLLSVLCMLSLLQSITVGQGLDDDRWHTVWVKRRAQIMEMKLDNNTGIQGKYSLAIVDHLIRNTAGWPSLYQRTKRCPVFGGPAVVPDWYCSSLIISDISVCISSLLVV